MRFLLIGALLQVISLPAQAQSSWLDSSLLNEKLVYASTSEACSKIKPDNLYGGLAFDQLYAGKFPSASFNKLIHTIFKEEFKKNTVYLLAESDQNENALWLLSSQSFNRAVNECFQDEKDRQQFKKLVSLRKRAGQTAGIVTSAVALSGVSSMLQKTSALLYRLWLGTGVAVVGHEAYANVQDVLQEMKSRESIQQECGTNPTLECITASLQKNNL